MPFLEPRSLEFIAKNIAVTVALSCLESFVVLGRSLRLIWGRCQFPNFLHSIGRRCVDGFMINVLINWSRCNQYLVSVWMNLLFSITPIDTPGGIAKTPILSLRCVDALWGKGLRAVVARFAGSIYTASRGCVDLTLETLAPSGHPDELPTDWVKSD